MFKHNIVGRIQERLFPHKKKQATAGFVADSYIQAAQAVEVETTTMTR